LGGEFNLSDIEHNNKQREEALNEALRAVELLFLSKLPARLNEIQQALMQFALHPKEPESLALLHRLLHTMAGSAGTFGFTSIGLEAKVLESKLKPLLKEYSWKQEELDCFSEEVKQFITLSLIKAQTQQSQQSQQENAQSKKTEPETASQSEDASHSDKHIFLLDHDEIHAQELKQHLEQFGCRVFLLNNPSEMGNLFSQHKPHLLLADIGNPANQYAGAKELEEIRLSMQTFVPTIYYSNSNVFECRLRAVRSGGEGFFTKPIEPLALAERIEELINKRQPKNYRILIIDDDIDTATYYATVLKNVGMQVEVLNDPTAVLELLASFRPELILMDVYMPRCDGVEIFKLIRQDRSYLDVPIVFLSSEKDQKKQLDAIRVGADDFLSKPVAPEFLVTAVATRAERYRALRGLVTRDGLTGLFNHSAIKENLISTLAVAGRNTSTTSLAMIDLDNFKLVNDTYGHQVGDQVLKTLSHILKKRLRKSDVVGRYGGEEFIVIFPNTDESTAASVLDQVREAFLHVLHYSSAGEFTACFSAGVAATQSSNNSDELIAIADAALYNAKRTGKNRVVAAANLSKKTQNE
jgi:diguanylate cyclase (GGDEF)-like protein